MNRIEVAAERCAVKLAALGGFVKGKSLADFEAETTTLTFDEHFQYQTLQSQAFASGKLTLEEAQTIYSALGEVMNQSNGGWAEHADLATKIAVTQTIGELANLQVR